MATYSQAGKFGPATVSGAPVGVPLRVTTASGSDAVLYRDASKNKTTGPVVQSDEAGNVTFFADPGTYTVRWTGGSQTVTVAGGTAEPDPGGVPGPLQTNQLAVGDETLPRELAISAAVASTNSTLRLAFFTARRTEQTTQVRILSGGGAAGATPTLIRVGLYTVAANGDIALVASTPNDTSLLAASNTAYTKSWSTPYAKVAGQRYAVGALVVTGAAAPNYAGMVMANAAESGMSPMLAASVGGQSDLPTSVVAASLTASANRLYAVVLP